MNNNEDSAHEYEHRYIEMADRTAYKLNEEGRITIPRAAHFTVGLGVLGLSPMNDRERDYILGAIGPTDSVLEIGTFHGALAAYWAQARPDAFFVSIDDYESHKDCSLVAAYANRQPNQVLIIGKSKTLLNLLQRKFDLIFIDADHREDGCKADLSMCLNLVEDDGVIICHDYYPKDEGRVASAVDEFNGTQGWKIVRVYQHLAILRKQK